MVIHVVDFLLLFFFCLFLIKKINLIYIIEKNNFILIFPSLA